MPLGEESKGNVLAYISSEGGKACLAVCIEPRYLRLDGLCVDEVQISKSAPFPTQLFLTDSLQSCWPKEGQSEAFFYFFS